MFCFMRPSIQRGLTSAQTVCRRVYHPQTLQLTRLLSETKTSEHSDKDSVKMTDSCVQKLLSFGDSNQDACLRVMVEGGGCSGFQYKFDMDCDVTAEDRVFERNGARLIVDTESLDFLKGATVDFQEELIRTSFLIIDNPQAGNGCSCGVSFTVKDL